MKKRLIACFNLIMCTIAVACSGLSTYLQPTPTPAATATLTPIPTSTSTSLPPTETPLPTQAAPAAPIYFNITYRCTRLNSSGGRPMEKFGVDFRISWEGRSKNETGFIIYKNNVVFKQVEKDIIEVSDSTEINSSKSETVVYSIQAFNEAGKSELQEKSIFYTCK